MPHGMKVGLGRGDFVLDDDCPKSPKMGMYAIPNVLVHVHSAKTDGWIKMPLGTEGAWSRP